MSETAFLQELLALNNTPERRELEDSFARIKRDEHCVQRAMWLMALFTALAAAVLAYGLILQENFLTDQPTFFLRFICALGLASLISLAVLACLLAAYRRRMSRWREECRRLITNLVASRLPATQPAEMRGATTEKSGGELK